MCIVIDGSQEHGTNTSETLLRWYYSDLAFLMFFLTQTSQISQHIHPHLDEIRKAVKQHISSGDVRWVHVIRSTDPVFEDKNLF